MSEDPYASIARPLGVAPPSTGAADQGGDDPYAGLGKVIGATRQPETDAPAGLADQAIASLADDPQARARYYAKQRGIPLDRYRIVGNSAVAYEDDNGVLQYEEQPLSWSPSAIAANLARGVGPSISTVPPTAAGILTAPALLTGPLGMAGSILATGTAGAAAQGLREGLAKQFVDQEPDAGRVAMNAATAGLGQGIGAGMTAFANRYAAPDIARYSKRATSDLLNKANNQGIRLTPAESTGLASLSAQQKALGNIPETADDMARFYRERADDEIAPAVNRFMLSISPQDSGEIAAKGVRDAAQSAILKAEAARSAASGPIYRKAFEIAKPVDTSGILQSIDKNLAIAKGASKRALESARSMLMSNIDEGVPETNAEALHQVKLAIRGAGKLGQIDYNGQSYAIDKYAKGQLASIERQIKEAIEQATIDGGESLYAKAANVHRTMSGLPNEVQDSVLSIIAKVDDAKVQSVLPKLFSPLSVGPKAAANVRKVMESTAPQEWQAAKRAYLQSMWQKAGKETLSGGAPVNQGAKWRLSLLGDQNQKAVLQQVLSKDEYSSLNDLADVLEAAGRVKPIGSDTAWNQEMMKAMRSEARPLIAKVAKFFTTNIGPELSEAITEWRVRGNAKSLAEAITKPGAIDAVRSLRQLSSAGARGRALAAHLVTVGVPAGVDKLLFDPSVQRPIQQ